ncbi:hypothetical protein [Clostridium haemolyticum]|uniref:Nal1 N-terminal domain-containing protein n=1 Tax=Clostridium haemolyticum NCTC 9693 TaxID=1443114 RepID=A0ABR4THV8_CLOHA|nr:hypothetical protein [Clostridium haemolyticum]KEI18024.1 hypothetical protein Z960_04620 [Clostridium haemolyticum NCTC 9693]KGM99791.1 hypothetical protein Z961_11490 [Clostridium haemolyticum NCTC 8350]
MKSNCFSLNNLNTIEDKILYICRNEYSEFLKKPNVVGVGLGYKTSGGFRTNEKCINVLVTKKVPSYNLSHNEVIPKCYKGIKTDIYESGFFKSHLLNSRVRPVLGGYSISPSTLKQYGSMACVVMDNLSNYFILSCNHVIANLNELQLGTSIVQPSVFDNGKSPRDLIGSLYKFIPLKFNTSKQLMVNYVDAALAIIPNKSLVSNKIYILGKPNNPISPSLDLSVRKAGRTTDITYGYIKILGTTVNLHFTNKSSIFKNQILTTVMSNIGDSGALLMDLKNNSVGLIIGGSTTHTIVTPINYVLDALDVKIVTD